MADRCAGTLVRFVPPVAGTTVSVQSVLTVVVRHVGGVNDVLIFEGAERGDAGSWKDT